MTTRAEVVATARSWKGTPFHHQARLKGVGVDCVGLIVGVGRELGMVAPDFDYGGYSRNPDGVELMEQSRRYMREISQEEMQPGDVIVLRFGKHPQHFGILADYRHGGLSVIHSAMRDGGVIETRLMLGPAMQFVAAFSLSGVE